MLNDPIKVFLEEARELLAELESALLELEENPADRELIGRVFRALHTIKGSGAMFGFDHIAAFAHEVENIYDLVREGRMSVSSELVNLSLAARDRIRMLLEAGERGEAVDPAENQDILQALARLRNDSAPTNPEQSEPPSSSTETDAAPDHAGQEDGETAGTATTYRIHFAPHRDFFHNGSNPLPLLNELQGLGGCEIKACPAAIPDLAAVDPAGCYLSWDITLTTEQGINAIRDVFIFVEDLCQLTIEPLNPAGDAPGEQQPAPGKDNPTTATYDRGQISKLSPCEPARSQAPASPPGPLPTTGNGAQPPTAGQTAATAVASIRVDAARLDALVNLAGEMVTLQARLSSLAGQLDDPQLPEIAEELERLSADLRDRTMGIRMMPIGSIFSKFRRLVRDLSRELGKEVQLTTAGEETELDKTVIEKLNDPLVHLIRNSIDHGIEAPDERAQQGKDRRGRVHLSAVHSGDSVFIEISDDGAGLNPEKLRRKAVEKGLLAADDSRSDQEIFQLLFLPGFSTAQQVSSVSGRGVGMDVVKRGIEELRGNIELGSELGAGTRVRVRLPLTLAIIESLLVAVGDTCFVLPLGLVEECIEATGEREKRERPLLKVRDSLVPYIPLRRYFAITGEPPPIEQVVIVRLNDEQLALGVDHVVGEHQTVIKPLGPLYRQVKEFSGATILGDGSLALIMDIPQLLASCRTTEERIQKKETEPWKNSTAAAINI